MFSKSGCISPVHDWSAIVGLEATILTVTRWLLTGRYTGQYKGQYGMVYDLIILHDAAEVFLPPVKNRDSSKILDQLLKLTHVQHTCMSTVISMTFVGTSLRLQV